MPVHGSLQIRDHTGRLQAKNMTIDTVFIRFLQD